MQPQILPFLQPTHLQERKGRGCLYDLLPFVLPAPFTERGSEGGISTDTSVTVERDSRKDQAVVLIFIIMTGGLLVWAGIRHWVVVRCSTVLLPSWNPLFSVRSDVWTLFA